MTTTASRTQTTSSEGNDVVERRHARHGHEHQQDLLRRIGRRRDRVAGEYGESHGLGQPLMVFLAGRDRDTDEHPFHAAPHGRSLCHGSPLVFGRAVPRMTGRARRGGGLWSRGVVVGDEPRRSRSFGRDHRQAARGIRPAGPHVRRPDDQRHRFRSRSPARGGDREGDSPRRRHQRRQLEHHDRPSRTARPTTSSGWSPASTTHDGLRSTSASASRPSRPCRGPQTA